LTARPGRSRVRGQAATWLPSPPPFARHRRRPI